MSWFGHKMMEGYSVVSFLSELIHITNYFFQKYTPSVDLIDTIVSI